MSSPAPGFVSTRSSSSGGVAPISLAEALARGLAPDGGLWVPQRLPRASPGSALGSATESLVDAARAAIDPWLDHPDDAPLRARLPALVEEAFRDPIPLVPLDEEASLMELFHGPTAAFKDFAARFLAAAMASMGMERHLLVATSGDTGSAVAAAFAERAGFRVSVLHPASGVSSRQAHLLGCFGAGGNVRSFRVEGTFDDAQRMVKAALSDPELVRGHRLSSANSISLGRLLPQMTWFAHHAATWAARTGRRPGFIVPSGNLGHGLAALWARGMGFPVGRIHLATNRNRALVDWVETGEAHPRPAMRTPANAMDVGVPSNLERLRTLLPHSHTPPGEGDWGRGAGLSAGSVDDEAISLMLAQAPSRWGTVVCPHTACALHELQRLRAEGDRDPWIVAATAHPAKFPEIVEPRVGGAVPVPPALQALLERPASSEALEKGPEALARALETSPGAP